MRYMIILLLALIINPFLVVIALCAVFALFCVGKLFEKIAKFTGPMKSGAKPRWKVIALATVVSASSLLWYVVATAPVIY